jgi:hypothetical protein
LSGLLSIIPHGCLSADQWVKDQCATD